MRSFLLLILSLVTGVGASFEVKGCPGGLIEFSCKYEKRHGRRNIVVKGPMSKSFESTQTNKWETKGNISLYHDTNNNQLKVVIKELKEEDLGDYKCTSSEKKVKSISSEVEVGQREDCPGPFLQTAYRTAKTTITCDYPENEDESGESSVKFFCKEDLGCEEILSTESSPKTNGTFSLIETNSGFNISISNVSSQDAGVYWCAEKLNNGRYRTTLRKIQLVVENITDLMRSPTIGQTLTYFCEYPDDAPITKFVCKGEDPSMCQYLVSTTKARGKFLMKDDRTKRNVAITVRDVSTDDIGTYWCGARRTDNKRSNPFFQRLVMTVEGSWLTVIIAAIVCVTALVLVLILVLICKRFQRPKTINTEAQNKEDGAYEEIQELPQKQSGTALKTIYATAELPTNTSSAPQPYSYINFQNSSAVDGASTYSTAKDDDQRPTYSTVNHPSRFSETPFYSTVSMPQQH